MYIKLCFDYHEKFLWIPDGYINDLSQIQSEFFEWLYMDGSDVTTDKSGHIALAYDENTFLKFVNDTILKNSSEKAYITNRKKGGKLMTLHF